MTHYIPAPPGYFVVQRPTAPAPEGPTLDQYKRWPVPVLAWAISDDEPFATPITLLGPWNDASMLSPYLIAPNGKLYDTCDGEVFASIEEAYAMQGTK